MKKIERPEIPQVSGEGLDARLISGWLTRIIGKTGSGLYQELLMISEEFKDKLAESDRILIQFLEPSVFRDASGWVLAIYEQSKIDHDYHPCVTSLELAEVEYSTRTVKAMIREAVNPSGSEVYLESPIAIDLSPEEVIYYYGAILLNNSARFIISTDWEE